MEAVLVSGRQRCLASVRSNSWADIVGWIAMALQALLAGALGRCAICCNNEEDVWAADEAARCRRLYALLPRRKEESGLITSVY